MIMTFGHLSLSDRWQHEVDNSGIGLSGLLTLIPPYGLSMIEAKL